MTPIFADAPRYLVAVLYIILLPASPWKNMGDLVKRKKASFKPMSQEEEGPQMTTVFCLCKGFVTITQGSILLLWWKHFPYHSWARCLSHLRAGVSAPIVSPTRQALLGVLALFCWALLADQHTWPCEVKSALVWVESNLFLSTSFILNHSTKHGYGYNLKIWA